MAEPQMAPAASLRSLLDASEYDDDAVRAFIQNNPDAVRQTQSCGLNVLFAALWRDACSLQTIRLLCASCPELVQKKGGNDLTALHYACCCGTTLDVVDFLYEQWPEAVATKDDIGRTTLHAACTNPLHGPPLDVVAFLVNKNPKALAVKDLRGCTPLSLACINRVPEDDLLIYLVEKNPDAVKERHQDDSMESDLTPLHSACRAGGASLKVLAMLVDQYPEALESITALGNTPLHLACDAYGSGATLEVVQLLVERCPKALKMENVKGQTPLQQAKDSTKPSAEVIDLLTALQTLENLADNDQRIIDTLCLFLDMKWSGGVSLVLNAFPSAANKLDRALMPTVLSLVGRRCTLNTFYAMVLDNPTLVKGAVKKGEQAERRPAKKARK